MLKLGASALREHTHLVGMHFIKMIPCRPGGKRKWKICACCSAIKKCTDVSHQCAQCKIALCMIPYKEGYY